MDMLDHQSRLAGFCWKSAVDVSDRSHWLDEEIQRSILTFFGSEVGAESAGGTSGRLD